MTETYNGWANRETWAMMLHVNNDEALQSGALDAIRATGDSAESDRLLREYAEMLFTRAGWDAACGGQWPDGLADASADIGSLWRVDWRECVQSLVEAMA